MSDFWVFGYGSLMWRPGFSYQKACPAVLQGYHRSFCVYSRHWRGTAARPGLVLGLTPGGVCRGIAFQVEAAQQRTVTAYLNGRELTGYAYLARHLPVQLPDKTVSAYGFIADPEHRHYAGDLPAAEAARIIMEAQGVGGLNRDYLIHTIRKLEDQGFGEPGLHALLRLVEELTGKIDQGGGI